MAFKPDKDGDDGNCLLEPLETHYSHLAETTVLADLRRDPRYDTQFPAEVISANDGNTIAIVSNLSRSGLRLEGNRQMLDTLFPDYRRQNGHTPAPLQVHFSVPGDPDRTQAVKVRCRSVYIRQEGSDTWQVGMMFTGIEEGSDALTRYLFFRGETA